MKTIYKMFFLKQLLVVCAFIGLFTSCKNTSDNNSVQETIIRGSATIAVDETLTPIMEDQIAVFENQYPAKIKQINASESEVIQMLTTQKHAIALLARELTEVESAVFRNKKIKARTTPIAIDAIALITNNNSKDTLVDVKDILNVMKNESSNVSGLVFEDSNASTISYLNRLACISKSTSSKIYSLNSIQEVFDYVIANPNKIGVIGLNILVQPTAEIAEKLKKVKVMSVRNVNSVTNNKAYYKPSQDNLGAELYPLSRKVYMLNYQGGSGLGMGFASFVAGDIGQRIILKSGLLPITIPSRQIQTRKGILNNQLNN